MDELHRPREEIEESLERLDAARHLKLVPGTHRILMAFPFSGIATPHRVVLSDGRSYYANCAWDAIAFHAMLRKPVRVESYCHHCGHPLSFQLRNERLDGTVSPAPIVYLGLPAAEWWNDIISTCANTMLFFSSSEHLRQWRQGHPDARGAELEVEVVVRLSGPLYAGKLDRGYVRPTRDQLIRLFGELKLTGDFWKI